MSLSLSLSLSIYIYIYIIAFIILLYRRLWGQPHLLQSLYNNFKSHEHLSVLFGSLESLVCNDLLLVFETARGLCYVTSHHSKVPQWMKRVYIQH